MIPFTRLTATACPLYRSDIDTDQIIPREFLTRTGVEGYADGLLHDWRFGADGTPDPDFPLNRPEWSSAEILVAGPNFGCGSSREHAVWALRDFGIRAIVAPSFGDIFRSNCTGGGLLAVTLPEDDVKALAELLQARPTMPVTADLEAQTVAYGNVVLDFEFDPRIRNILLKGLDRIGITLQAEPEIGRYEADRPAWLERALS